MKTDNYGRVIISEQEAFDSLYSGKIKDLDGVFLESGVEAYNQARKLNADRISELKNIDQETAESLELFDQLNQSNWFMPKEYKEFPLESWLLEQCKSEKEKIRVKEELDLFTKFKMVDLLFYLKYLVDTMREEKIVWGVGRGSSVASYVLYLIGVHRIDSIKYNLDITEFLK